MSYTRLLEHQNLSQAKSDPLTTALIVLGVRPFTPESVAVYKAKVVKVFQADLQKKIDSKMKRMAALNHIQENILGFVRRISPNIRLACRVFYVTLVSFLLLPMGLGFAPWDLVSICLSLTSLYFCEEILTWAGFIPRRLSNSLLYEVASLEFESKSLRWERMHYEHGLLQARGIDVPEVVKQRARDIKKHLPEVQLFVDYLESEPFLVSIYNHMEYYTDVWNEPTYQEERIN